MSEFYKQVLVKITTDTQYDSIKPVLKELAKNKTVFDVYIPKRKENLRNINEMFERTYHIVKKDGFSNIIRKVSPKNHYHLALIAPHPEKEINAKYYIKYSYGSCSSVKPSFTHHAHLLNHYHGYLTYNARDAEIFSAFTKTYLMPNLKYINYKHISNVKPKKQTILFLPSWDDQNSLDWIALTSHKLKKDYHIIVKLHPYGDFGTEVSKSAKDVKIKIQENSDEYYGGEASLSDLLSRSDLVISDISGAVFESMYVGIPVIIYSKNIHRFDVEGVKSATAKYADEGYISVSKTVNELVQEVPSALSDQYLQKQRDLSQRIFRQDFTTKAVDSWMKVINLYLNDEVNQDYIALHNLLSQEFRRYKNEAERLVGEVQRRDDKISDLSSELNSLLSIRRSTRLLGGNVKRKLIRKTKK